MAGPQGHPLRNILLSPIDLGTVIKWKGAPTALTSLGAALRPKGRAPVPETAPPPGGTRVQLRSYDLAEAMSGTQLPEWIERRLPDHSFVQFDDGRDRIIAKGGPSSPMNEKYGVPFLWNGSLGELGVVSEVRPAARSSDSGKGTKVLGETFVPGKGVKEVARPAQAYSNAVNRGQNRYGASTNSNSVAAGAYRASTGRPAPGRPDTWGRETRLGDGKLSADQQRARARLGTGLGTTDLGLAISKAIDVGEDLGYGLRVLATGKVAQPPWTAKRR